MFELHERLAADTHWISDWPLSRVLLMDDARFVWIILVPRGGDVSGMHQLAARERATLMEEIAQTSAALESLLNPDRINVGALGNIVPQLHIHVIARFRDDAAWPGPVWGTGPRQPRTARERTQLMQQLQPALTYHDGH